MTVDLTVFAIVLLLVSTIILVVVSVGLRTTTVVLRRRRRRRVLVTLRNGDSFLGVLVEADRECLVLRDAEALAYGKAQANVAVEGEALLDRATVAYMQVLPG